MLPGDRLKGLPYRLVSCCGWPAYSPAWGGRGAAVRNRPRGACGPRRRPLRAGGRGRRVARLALGQAAAGRRGAEVKAVFRPYTRLHPLTGFDTGNWCSGNAMTSGFPGVPHVILFRQAVPCSRPPGALHRRTLPQPNAHHVRHPALRPVQLHLRQLGKADWDLAVRIMASGRHAPRLLVRTNQPEAAAEDRPRLRNGRHVNTAPPASRAAR